MIFLSLSDLSLSSCARGDEDDSAHLGSTKEAIFAKILQNSVTAGLSPDLSRMVGIFLDNSTK